MWKARHPVRALSRPRKLDRGLSAADDGVDLLGSLRDVAMRKAHALGSR